MNARQMSSGSEVAANLVLETERLILRVPRRVDVDAIVRLADNRKLAEMTALIPHPYGRSDAEEWISSLGTAANEVGLGITLREDGAFIGACGLSLRGDGMHDLGYWIGEPYWGNGYATEAARALIDHAFARMNLAALVSCCRMKNSASRRVLEKCGFQWTGAALLRVRALAGSVPADQFRLEQSTWESLRAWGRSSLPRAVGGER
jgi:RimJ/RimL family protein N-acetyltransferase